MCVCIDTCTRGTRIHTHRDVRHLIANRRGAGVGFSQGLILKVGFGQSLFLEEMRVKVVLGDWVPVMCCALKGSTNAFKAKVDTI